MITLHIMVWHVQVMDKQPNIRLIFSAKRRLMQLMNGVNEGAADCQIVAKLVTLRCTKLNLLILLTKKT